MQNPRRQLDVQPNRRSPPKRGCENSSAVSTSAPLGSPVSAADDPMVRDRRWWLRPRRELADPMGLRRRIVGAVGRQVGSDPETRSHREPVATSVRSQNSQLACRAGA
jgi:hypothetical protein